MRHAPSDFWAKVDRRGPGECWPWIGSRIPNGYGQVKYHGQAYTAHDLAYILTNGPIPSGMLVMHSCDNPPCCNPAHLSAGTNLDNSRDMVKKNRHINICGERHWNAKLTDEQVRTIRKDIRRPCIVAKEYGVSPTHVSYLKSGRGRKGVVKNGRIV